MLKIGEFSKVCRITVKTLRYYSDIGLLMPREIDPFSGYRYYSPAQIIEVAKLTRLKEMGFSLEQIRMILAEKLSSDELHTLLSERLAETECELSQVEKQASAIKQFMNSLSKEVPMEQVTIKNVPTVLCATKRVVIPTYDALYEEAPAMGEAMKKHGAVCAVPAYCFNLYHDTEYRETDIDIEICEAVVDAKEDADGVVYKEIEGAEVAALMHRGPYDRLSDSYAHLYKWLEENGYEQSGLNRESYIDGIWNKDDPDEWLTELQVPVKTL